MQKLTVKIVPDCEFCNDEGSYEQDCQVRGQMISRTVPCICQIEPVNHAVEINKMSGLKETAQYFIFVAQDPLVGKFFDVNSPIGF